MRIGIIAHLKHPIKPPFAGGLEAFTYEVANRLTELGHDIYLFASSSSQTDGKLYPILDDANYDSKTGVRQRHKDLSSEYIAEHHAYYKMMLDIQELELDLVFNNSLHYVPITMANLLSIPMVTVLHTPPFYELKNAIKAQKPYNRVAFATVSKANTHNWGGYIDDCKVVLNGIDLGKWEYFEAGRQQDYAVWFGRIHPDKGLDMAIRAAKLAGLKLKVAGGIADTRYYRDKIEPLVDDSIEMVGLLSHQDLNKLIGEARVCLVTPVWEEPFGLVVAESLACGTPVAGFQIGALPEIISPDSGVLVSPRNVAGLAVAVQQAALLDRALVRQHAEQNLGIDKMLIQYEELFHSLLNKSLEIV